MNILEVLSRIAVLVNAVLIAFTFDWLPHWLYQCHFKSGKTTLSYVDFMLASHEFEHQNTDGSKVNQTCRYVFVMNIGMSVISYINLKRPNDFQNVMFQCRNGVFGIY